MKKRRKKPKKLKKKDLMAISITPNLTDVSMCESTTGWVNLISRLEADAGVLVEGNASLSAWIDATLSAVEYYTITSADLSNGEHVYIWMYCSGVIATKANGGFRIVLYTDASNYATFYVGGSDTHSTAWNVMCCDASAEPDAEVGNFDPSDVTRIGVQFNVVSAGFKKGQTYINNCYWDAVRYGFGLTVTSGVADGITFEDIYVEDNDNSTMWGVVQKSYGSYIVIGKLIFGDATGTGNIDFLDTSKIVVFPENDLVSDTFYGFEVVGNATGVTNFQLGLEAGEEGISGCLIQSSGSNRFCLDATDEDINVFKVKGSTFIQGCNIDFPTSGSGRGVSSCNFESCGDVNVSTCDVYACNFIDAVLGGIVVTTPAWDVHHCSFIACPCGIEIETAGEYDSYGNLFSENVYDICNTSGSTVIFNNLENGNAETYDETSGSTFINSLKQYTLDDLVTGSEIRAYVGTNPVTAEYIDGVESSGSSFTFSHQEAGNLGYVNVHSVGYVPITIYLTYPSTDTAIPISQRLDYSYDNP